jgi:hypothetical protein
MVAAASVVAVYFPESIDRLDAGHVVQMFTVALPLVILWAISLSSDLDRWSRRILVPRWRVIQNRGLRPFSAGLVLALSIGLISDLSTAVRAIPANLHPQRSSHGCGHSSACTEGCE